MKNSEKFLNAYTEIEQFLRTILNRRHWIAFSEMLDDASRLNSVVKRYRFDLKEYAELRNAIVHERGGNYVIAEPNDRAVEEIEHIAALLVAPPRIYPLFECKVLVLTVKHSIAEAVKAMYDNYYSQIPIYDGHNFIGLLTSRVVARWLGASVTEDVVNLHSTTISQVLAFTDVRNTCIFLPKHTTLFEATENFQEHERKGRRLEAILITPNGEASEKLLGMVTIFDLAKAQDEIEAKRGIDRN